MFVGLSYRALLYKDALKELNSLVAVNARRCSLLWSVGGKLNNERSALLFLLLFRKIRKMHIFSKNISWNGFPFWFIAWVFLGWFRLGKSYNTEKKYHFELSLCEQDDYVVNRPSLSLVSELRAKAADAVTFCFCIWELLNFYGNQSNGEVVYIPQQSQKN